MATIQEWRTWDRKSFTRFSVSFRFGLACARTCSLNQPHYQLYGTGDQPTVSLHNARL
jgi:hypothetical protein